MATKVSAAVGEKSLIPHQWYYRRVHYWRRVQYGPGSVLCPFDRVLLLQQPPAFGRRVGSLVLPHQHGFEPRGGPEQRLPRHPWQQGFDALRHGGRGWLRQIAKGWTMSTYLFAASDNSFIVQSESGFGCHQMAGGVGFHADASGDQVFGRGWARLARWRTSGNNELYSVGGGITSSTWYVAPSAGYYMCATQVRIDSASNTRFRMIIALDNGMDTHNGLHVSDGNQGSTNYRTMRIMGTVYLKKGVRTSVHVYSASDNSWRLQHESGFSCHKFAASAGGTLPGTTLKCGSVAGPICMGHNIKCWRTSLANCKATCKATAGCKIAEYSTGGTCCTSKYASKSDCPGSFTTSSAWKGYVVC